MIAAAYAGTGDQFWYVKPDSPLKTLADATDKHTMSYSTNGSTSHDIALGFGKQLGVKAKPTATGGPPATYTMTMSGQVDIGWARDAVRRSRRCRRASSASSRAAATCRRMRNQTVRVQVVNAERAEGASKDVMLRFMRAYRETLDWMYANPQAVKLYAEKMKMSENLIVLQRDQFNPKEAMLPDRLSDLDLVMEDAVALKFLDKPLTKDELDRAVPDPAGGVVVDRSCLASGHPVLAVGPRFRGDERVDACDLRAIASSIAARPFVSASDAAPACRFRPSRAGARRSPRVISGAMPSSRSVTATCSISSARRMPWLAMRSRL